MAGTAKEIFDGFKEKLKAHPDVGSSINAMVQFVLNGEGGGTWAIDLTKQPGEIIEGGSDTAACTLTMGAEDFVAMINKEANPMALFMSGRLKVGGDMSISMKLQGILDL
jgi:putative sterol carrier protein